MAKNKNKTNTPRHKRLNRQSRIQAAKHWIPKYEGKNLVHGYSRHFAVDKLCAVYELEMLGYNVKESYKQKLRETEKQKEIKAKKRKAAKNLEHDDELLSDSDETFAFIAGYTAGGVPFDVTWEELVQQDSTSEVNQTQEDSKSDKKRSIEDWELPF